MEKVLFINLNSQQKELILKAKKTAESSYSPYSNFKVGSAVLTCDNEIITGTNFENASYGGTICAERSAIVSANSQNKRHLKSIAVIAGNSNKNALIISPCGICRQLIFESSQISEIDIEILMSSSDCSEVIISKISELLPLAFGPKNL